MYHLYTYCIFLRSSGDDDRHKNRYDSALYYDTYYNIVSRSISKRPRFAVFNRDENFFFQVITVTVSIPTEYGGEYYIYIRYIIYIYFYVITCTNIIIYWSTVTTVFALGRGNDPRNILLLYNIIYVAVYYRV